jgi:hypothetical protein
MGNDLMWRDQKSGMLTSYGPLYLNNSLTEAQEQAVQGKLRELLGGVSPNNGIDFGMDADVKSTLGLLLGYTPKTVASGGEDMVNMVSRVNWARTAAGRNTDQPDFRLDSGDVGPLLSYSNQIWQNPVNQFERNHPYLMGGVEDAVRVAPYAVLGGIELRTPATDTPPLANLFEGHTAGQGFTGVFDASTGKVLIAPSTADAVIPDGWVPRTGGHADVSAALGGDAASHSGFAVILQNDGSLNITWRSGTLNPPPNYVVPPALRQQIIDEIEAATGRTVNP